MCAGKKLKRHSLCTSFERFIVTHESQLVRILFHCISVVLTLLSSLLISISAHTHTQTDRLTQHHRALWCIRELRSKPSAQMISSKSNKVRNSLSPTGLRVLRLTLVRQTTAIRLPLD